MTMSDELDTEKVSQEAADFQENEPIAEQPIEETPVILDDEPEEDIVEEGAAAGKEERLAKFLAAAGIASRRSCEELIEEGRVTVNGVAVTTPAYNVDPDKDEVRFEGHVMETHPQGKVYIILNKPVGYTCSAKDDHAEHLVFELIPERFGRLFTVGRLDRDSEGMLILTNDGDFAQRLMHPSRQIIKRYYVECEGQFSTSLRRRMIEGFYDNEEFIRALNVEEQSVQKGHCSLIVTLGEGRKREVRRLCKDVGLEVRVLRRVSIGGLDMDSKLTTGSWRMLTEEEQAKLFDRVELPAQAASADPRPYWQKSGREERKPFDRDHRPFTASPYPEYKDSRDNRDNDRFGDRKPFDRDRKPFGDRDRFDRGDRKPFDRDRKHFGDRDRFDRGDRKPKQQNSTEIFKLTKSSSRDNVLTPPFTQLSKLIVPIRTTRTATTTPTILRGQGHLPRRIPDPRRRHPRRRHLRIGL